MKIFKKIFVFLFLFIFSIFFQLNYVDATCYKYCLDGKCEYGFSEFKCYYVTYNKGNKSSEYVVKNASVTFKSNSSKNVQEVQMDYCINNGKDITLIDDVFCSNSNYENLNDDFVSCGNNLLTDIPVMVPKTVHIIYLLLQIAIPIILVVLGSFDFVKAITSTKEDEIKKGQQTFIKRLIAAALVFFVFAIVKLLVSFVNSDSSRGIDNIIDCVECFINNDNNCVK